jgi:hypothetical protein
MGCEWKLAARRRPAGNFYESFTTGCSHRGSGPIAWAAVRKNNWSCFAAALGSVQVVPN